MPIDFMLKRKLAELERYIAKLGQQGVVVALSGGMDSSTLAAICHRVLGSKAVAATAISPIHPPWELESAKQFASKLGIKHYLVQTDELSDPNFTRNPPERCYYCKIHLIKQLRKLAEQLGFKLILEGTCADDLAGHRPGYRAIQESQDVLSPWVELGFTKSQLKLIARKLGIQQKPSMACLASRIPFGEEITPQRLSRISDAEQLLRKLLGEIQLRVRDHSGLARIELDPRYLSSALKLRSSICAGLKQLGFSYVSLDLEGYRSGSLAERI